MGCGAARMIPDSSLAQLGGHTAGILGLATFLVDGEVRVASASHDKTVRIWRTTGECLIHVLEGHGDFLTAICAYESGGARYFIKVMTAFKDASTGDALIASSALDGTIRTWRGDDGSPVAVIKVHAQPPGHELSSIRRQSLVAPPRKRGSMVGGAQGGARKSQYKSKVAAKPPPGGEKPAFAIAAFDGATRLVTGHADGTMKTWANASGDAAAADWQGHEAPVFALCVFAGAAGERCASGSGDFSIKVWDLAARAALVTIPGAHDEKVCCLACFAPPDGSPAKLVSGSGDMQLALWDAEATPELEPPEKGKPDDDEEAGPRSKAINRLEGHTTVVSSWGLPEQRQAARRVGRLGRQGQGGAAKKLKAKAASGGGMRRRITNWDTAAWTAVEKPEEFWEGVDDAAVMGLEEIPGDVYAKLARGEPVDEPSADAVGRRTARTAPTAGATRRGRGRAPPPKKKKKKKQQQPQEEEPPAGGADDAAKRLAGAAWASSARGDGLGKTLAFALPLLHDALAHAEAGAVRSVVLAPTRELAAQIAAHALALLPEGHPARGRAVCCVVGGLSEQKQERVLAKGPPIVVATPGRLWELVDGGKAAPVRRALEERTLRFLVLDEADRMLEPGAFDELAKLAAAYLIDDPAKPKPKKRWQTLVFSALAEEGRLGKKEKFRKKRNDRGDVDGAGLLERVAPLRSPSRGALEVVDLTTATAPGDAPRRAPAAEPEKLALPAGLDVSALKVVDAEKLGALFAILQRGDRGRAVVFTNAIASTRRLATALHDLKVPGVASLHAAMQQRARLKAVDRFAGDARGVLVATDVAALGLDVKGVRTVVHFDVAATLKLFVHRAGRTARAGAAGSSISIVGPRDAAKHAAIAAELERPFSRHDLDQKLFAAALERSSSRRSSQEADEAARAHAGDRWADRIARDADLLVDDDDRRGGRGDARPAAAAPGKRKKKRDDLNALLGHHLASRPKNAFAVVDAAAIARLGAERAAGKRPRPEAQATKKRNKRRRG
ncbi:helicase [Aureococcus anophagefferens]|nr:helicase [Aureococcus anophagefferens]